MGEEAPAPNVYVRMRVCGVAMRLQGAPRSCGIGQGVFCRRAGAGRGVRDACCGRPRSPVRAHGCCGRNLKYLLHAFTVLHACILVFACMSFEIKIMR